MSDDFEEPAELPDPEELAEAALAVEGDEDLFDFDELLEETQRAVEVLNDDLDELAPESQAASAEPAPVPAASAAPVAPVAPAAPVTNTTVLHQKLSITPLAVAVLVAVVLVNLGLAYVSWRSLASVQELVLGMGNEVIETTRVIRDEAAERAATFEEVARPIVSPGAEGSETLEQAVTWLEQGQFARARRSLFALLAVIDRVDAGARADIEAQARFLVADSYRLEADWLERVSPEGELGAERPGGRE